MLTINNLTEEEIICNEKRIPPSESITLSEQERIQWAESDATYSLITSGKVSFTVGTSTYIDAAKLVSLIKAEITEVGIKAQPPFAEPDYTTKRIAINNVATIQPGETVDIDLQITSEIWISGGQMVMEGQQIGDWFSASVYDKDSVIPEPYRVATCEAWPIANLYIEKNFVSLCPTFEINTYPLVAKISPGLYMRVTYNAISTGGVRKLGINYYTYKKNA